MANDFFKKWRFALLLLLATGGAFIFSLQFKSTEREGLEIQRIKSSRNVAEQTLWYTKLIERKGPAEAQEDLFHSGLPFNGQTHLLNHTAGEYLHEKYGAAGLVLCKDYFLSSCYHGFILRAIGSGGMDAIDEVFGECAKQKKTVVAQCSHAIGHGFLAWAGYRNLTDALKLCDEANGRINGFPIYNCYDGLFMENIWGTHGGQPSPDRWVNPADPVYPCSDPRIEEKYRKACWSNQPHLMYQLFSGDVEKVGKECLKVENAEYQKTCFNALARQIHPLANGDIREVFRLCDFMPSAWVSDCVNDIAVSEFSVGGRDMPFQICALVYEQSKELCYQRLWQSMNKEMLNEQAYGTLCASIQEKYWREQCLSSRAATQAQ